MLTGDALSRLPKIRHGFLGRKGGVSTGLCAGLNCGYGSTDAPDDVTANRILAVERLGLGRLPLVTVHQVHSPTAVVVESPWPHTAAPQADALVTRQKGLALGILTADCAPILLADGEAGVVGAAHAGWKGAKGGVIEATLAAMEGLGAHRTRISALIGPCIAWESYEVGPEFVDSFQCDMGESSRYFRPSPRPPRSLFNLPGYVEDRLRAAGVAAVAWVGADTLPQEVEYFSYRRSTLRGEPTYGRQIALIALAP